MIAATVRIKVAAWLIRGELRRRERRIRPVFDRGLSRAIDRLRVVLEMLG